MLRREGRHAPGDRATMPGMLPLASSRDCGQKECRLIHTLLGYYTNFYYLLTVDNTISTVVKISLKKLILTYFQIIKENMIFKWLFYNRLNTCIQYRGLFPIFLDNVILQKFYK